MFRLLFKHISENGTLYRTILDSLTFSRRLREHVIKMVQQHLNTHAHRIASPAFPLEVAAQHMVSSLLGLIDRWISQSQPYPIDRMASIYVRLIVQATWHALGEDNPMVLPW